MTRFTLQAAEIQTAGRAQPVGGRRRSASSFWSLAVVAAFSYDKLPFVNGTSDYSAYFAEAGGIKPGSDVRVSGMSVGRVSEVSLEGTKVLVDFTVARRRRAG